MPAADDPADVGADVPADATEDFEADPRAVELAEAVRRAGGHALVVGGWVRDAFLGRASSDVDLEVHGLDEASLDALLAAQGAVRRVGRSHAVWLVGDPPFEVSCAGSETPLWEGSGAADASIDERHARAARRRDLSVNSMAWDPLARRLLDPHGGRRDLQASRLRATDPDRFAEDPLRILRVARFAAQLDARPTPELVAQCRGIDARAVAPERVGRELERLLACPRPSAGLEVAHRVGALHLFPELACLEGTPQDERWHPEGCVWTHTLMVVDEAAALRTGEAERDIWLLWGALCHDLGKPATTTVGEQGVRSPGHAEAGEEVTEAFLRRLRLGERSVRAVSALVRWHLAPALYEAQEAGDRGYRRLARRLGEAGIDGALLVRLARADHWGRTTEAARARRFDEGDRFSARLRALEIEERPVPDAVLGRDVLAHGVAPGPRVGQVLARCREIQDETGWVDTQRILARALRETPEG